MTRLGLLPEEQEDQTIAQILREVEQLKNRQVAGGHSLVVFYNKTANTWDVDTTISGLNNLERWRVTFTPDNVDRPHSEFSYDYLVTPDNGFNDGAFDAYPDPANIDASAVVYIVEYIPGLDPVNVKLKFGLKSLDTGTITWEQLPGI